MRAFARTRKNQRFFDLAPRTKSQKEVVNLKPSLLKRYHKPAVALLVAVVIGSLAYTRFFTQASAAYFYPASCLGTWKHVGRAEGKPQAVTADEVRPSQSAFFEESGQEIYCGGFAGSIPEGVMVTKMQLLLAWNVTRTELIEEDKKIVIPAEPSRSEDDDDSEGDEPSSIIDVPTSETVEFEIQRIEPDGTPYEEQNQEDGQPESDDEGGASEDDGSSESDGGNSGGDSGGGSGGDDSGGEPAAFLGIAVAHAQEADTQATVEEPVVGDASQEEPAAEPVVADEPAPEPEPPAEVPASDAEPAADQPSGDIPVTRIDMPEDLPDVASLDPGSAFLAIQYTLDGSEWHLLKNVNEQNWNEPVDLPIAQWEDIAKLQVKIARLQTLDEAPFVYLDGMELAAEYDDGVGMPMPDFERDVPRAILSNPSYVIADTTREEDGKRVLWLFERTENPQWRKLADESSMASSSSVGLKGASVFWVSRDRRSIVGYRADTSTYFSQTLDGRNDESTRLVFADGRYEAMLRGSAFVFRDLESGKASASDNDAEFSDGFWEYAAGLYDGQLASTTTSTAVQASTTDAVLSSSTESLAEDPVAEDAVDEPVMEASPAEVEPVVEEGL